MNATSLNETLSTALYLRKRFLWVNVHILPVILILGLVGNVASIVVCLSPKLRRISSNLYLMALAFYDTIVLVLIILNWLSRFHLGLFNTFVGCPILTYLLNVSTNLSSWSLTAFTIERFVVVTYPLHRANICTSKKTRIILASLLPYPLLINIYELIVMRVNYEGYCDVGEDFVRLHQILGWLDSSVCFGLPLLIILLLNTLISRKVLAHSREAKILWAKCTSEAKKVEQKDRSITRVLLVVSATFALLNLPAYILRSKAQFVVATGQFQLWSDWDESLEQLAYLLYYSNFAVDFLLYCMSSQHFRSVAFHTFMPSKWTDRSRSTLRKERQTETSL